MRNYNTLTLKLLAIIYQYHGVQEGLDFLQENASTGIFRNNALILIFGSTW